MNFSVNDHVSVKGCNIDGIGIVEQVMPYGMIGVRFNDKYYEYFPERLQLGYNYLEVHNFLLSKKDF